MKNYSLFLLLLTALTGCGQVGPLYLPGTPPPIHVEPEPQPEAKKPVPEQKTPAETKSEPEKTK
jgi:predicted small lipoprotein YifL